MEFTNMDVVVIHFILAVIGLLLISKMSFDAVILGAIALVLWQSGKRI